MLSDGSFYCVYRTIDGHPACAYSRDGGHTWTAPQYQALRRRRALDEAPARGQLRLALCATASTSTGSTTTAGASSASIRAAATIAYEDRNPVWLCGGVEADTPEGKVIRWSQPEIVLYDDDPYIRMSYPDLVEEERRSLPHRDAEGHGARPRDRSRPCWRGCGHSSTTTRRRPRA